MAENASTAPKKVAATFSDPGHNPAKPGDAGDCTATIDWGDAKTSAGTIA